MSLDFSMSALSPITPLDLSPDVKGAPNATRIQQVSKAMESLFVNQLTAELGKGIDDTDDAKESGPYQDFIQQAMTQGVTQGGGLGLAKIIQNYLTERNQTQTGHHLTLEPKNTSYHVPHAE